MNHKWCVVCEHLIDISGMTLVLVHGGRGRAMYRDADGAFTS
jgi:hypothetical protein